jgi:hypothetical protein
MHWSGEGRDIAHTTPLHAAWQLEPLPERLPWQLAALVILGLSALLWGLIGYGAMQLLG